MAAVINILMLVEVVSSCFFFLVLQPWRALAIGSVCGNAGNYPANGTYQSNLGSLSRTLPGNTSSSSTQFFATATAGRAGAPDAVYALALCRGDMTGTFTGCRDCVTGTFRYAQQSCPNAKVAAVYDDDCLLGFSNSSAILSNTTAAAVTQDTLFQSWNEASISGGGDTAAVGAGVRNMLNQTAKLAAGRSGRFVTAFMDGSSGAVGTTLYSTAQCTPDLSAGDCLACLLGLVGLLNATTSVRQGGRILVLRCNLRYENMRFFNDDNASMVRITPSSSSAVPPAPTTDRSTRARPPWMILPIVAALLALLCFAIFYCRRRRTRTRYTKGNVRFLRQNKGNNNLQQQQGRDEQLDWEMEGELSEFSVFDFDEILDATDNFSQENKLGEGGFGSVYKGQFPDGVEIAVKRLASHSGQGFVEFKNEVQLIAKLQHSNLVKLLGCCSQGDEKILVYEYLPNKSLDFYIFDETRTTLLDWNKRLYIIEGIAEGLLYMHKHSRLRVIHRDLKPSNILLDSELNPKISDFGLAKIFSSNNNEESTTRRVVGTYGYMAPEYASEGLFSMKSDVFSFGVLLLEILSGKRNSDSNECGDFINVLGYAWQLYEEERWSELIDTSLVPMHNSVEIKRCMNIALLCVQENAADRPTMSDVVAMLSSKTKILAEPKHPAHFNVRVGNEVTSTTATQSCSINDMTISITTAR
ncbi:unnamed protein product [Urochloa humidicola]